MNDTDQGTGLAISRRGLIKLAGALTLSVSAFPAGGRAFAETAETLRIIHPIFDMDWSALRGGGMAYGWNTLCNASPMYFDGEGKLHPYAVDRWEANEDRSEWTFTIAKGAVFSDGSPITSDDIKGSLELIAMPSTRHQRVDLVLPDVVGYDEMMAGAAKELAGVGIKDERTVVVKLSKPDPVFYMRLASQLTPIVKVSKVRDGNGEEIFEWWTPEKEPVYSGPFRPTAMNLDAGELTFERNEAFFGTRPKLSTIEIRSIEDPIAATALLASGQFDAHTDFSTPTLIEDLGEDFANGPLIPRGHHFWLNARRAPMDDINVRKALIMAIDRDELMRVAFPKGPHVKADQILDAVPGVDAAFQPYPYDPEAAKKALAESSYGGPEKLPRIMMVGISNPSNEVAAQYIAEQWRKVLGITAVDIKPQIDSYAGPDQGSVQIFRDDVGTRVPDPVVYLVGSIHSTSSNAINKLGGYKNEKVDAALDAAAVLAADDPERLRLAQEAQRLFRDDWTFIPWYHEVMSKLAMPQVKNIVKNLDIQVAEPWNLEVVR